MATAELIMPKMGESIMEATILRWHKKVGDYINMDETLLDIATDKVDSEVPSTAKGFITEILYSVNDVVPVGSILARIEMDVAVPVLAPQPEIAFSPASPITFNDPIMTIQEPIVEPVSTYQAPPQQDYIPFIPTSQNLTGNNNRFFSPLVLNIANSEGLSLSELERITGTGADGRVSKKDVLQYIADKRAGRVVTAVVEQPQQYYTKPAEVVAPVSIQQAPTPVIENILSVPIVEEKVEEVVHQKQEVTSYPIVETAPTVASVVSEVEASASAAAETSIDMHVETPVIETPVQASVKAEPPFDASQYKNVEIIEMDRMRKLISKHMVHSKATSPHVTSFAEADVTNMVNWRSKIKDEFEKREGMKITFTPMFIECILKVMKHYPIINSSVVGDKIIMKKDFNIGMATALPTGNLIVPVIKNAADMNFINLTRSVNTLADNARNGKLNPNDVMDGTFTFTNVGTFGSLMGTPIINQPQVAIIAVGEIKKRPVVVETDKGDFIGVRHMMYLSLSYDHRIIDGSIGASFLSDIAKELEAWDVNRQLKYVVKEWYVE